jgi:hypothetical protein
MHHLRPRLVLGRAHPRFSHPRQSHPCDSMGSWAHLTPPYQYLRAHRRLHSICRILQHCDGSAKGIKARSGQPAQTGAAAACAGHTFRTQQGQRTAACS